MSDFRSEILNDIAHRPWPMRAAPWVMTQTWHDLLFAHWPVAPDSLRSCVPAQLPLDVRDGRAWVGVIPFRMTNVAPRGLPNLPFVSAFPELNVRTYVTLGGRPGVYFFSLDAGSAVAAAAARTLFGLPYFTAAMTVQAAGEEVHYRSRRQPAPPPAAFEARYRPTGPAEAPSAGSLEWFLTERYCLYTVDSARRVHRVDIHHPPWPLQPASAEISVNTMAQAAGIALPADAPLLYFARRQNTVAWGRERITD